MFKIIFLVTKRSDMTREAYQAYSTDTHAPLVLKLPGLEKYVVNYGVGDAPAYDGAIELWFASAEAFQAALGSPEGQAALADQPNFLDTDKTVMLPVQELTF